MAKENSFDIVSKTDYAEITNALNQTTKEVSQRFDFKGSKATVELADKDLLMSAEDETRNLAEGARLSEDRTRRGRNGSPNGQDPAGNPDRQGERDRQIYQGRQA